MKMKSLVDGWMRSWACAQGLARRWKAALVGTPEREARSTVSTVQMALHGHSSWRLTGDVSGVAVEFREGGFWNEQAGAATDVPLQPGQCFLARTASAIVVNPGPGMGRRGCPLPVADRSAALSGMPARPGVGEELKPAMQSRLGLSPVDRGAPLEEVAFIILWLCAFAMVGCSLTMVASRWNDTQEGFARGRNAETTGSVQH